MKRFLPSFTLLGLLALALVLVIPAPTQAMDLQTDQFDRYDRDQGTTTIAVVNPAENGDFVNAASLSEFSDTDSGLDRVDVASPTQAFEGAHAPFPRARLAGNGIAEDEKGHSNSSALSYPGLVTGLNYAAVRTTSDHAFKLNRSPLMAPNGKHRYLASGDTGGSSLDIDGFRTARPSTVQLL